VTPPVLAPGSRAKGARYWCQKLVGALALAVAATVALAGGTTTAGAQDTTTSAPPPPPPKAWILVDADTGVVIDGLNTRQALPVASLSKIVTALAIVDALPDGGDVPVSALAEGMPARKINMKAGQTWTFEDSLASMMLSSANDAAVALAEKAAGSLEAFVDLLNVTATRIGLEDERLLQDPAGLDDEFSVGGGNLLSARDLAIATRAALADDQLAETVATPVYRFFGGDGIHHRLTNHNRLLTTYPGAIGVKTGYTRRSGRCLVAAARRDGRTLIAVVIDVYDIYGFAAAQLDRGFATPPGTDASPAGGDRLPPLGTVDDDEPDSAPDARPETSAFGDDVRSYRQELTVLAGALGLGLLWARARRRRRWRARQARRRSAFGAGGRPVPPGVSPGAGRPARRR
jgi:D-alanyl-D-alanine carboxypeptidase